MLAEDWGEITGRLDRQVGRRHPSADEAGLAELMRMYAVPGISIAARRGADSWAAGYGTTAAGGSAEIVPRTVFQACSISKHVAAFGVLRLVDQGVLALDEDVRAYLRSWRVPAAGGWPAAITLRQLLGHTAGLSYNWFRGFHSGASHPTMRQVLDGEEPANTPPVRVSLLPGSRFRYSGSHYAVVQQLLTDVTGAGFAELMRTLVLEPLGMADCSYDQSFPHGRGDLVAIGHQVDGTPVSGRWRVQPEAAGAGLWTTPADLARLGVEIARAAAGEPALLSGELAGQMLTVQVPGGDYGLGTQVDGERFGHVGGNIGYGCWLFTWRESGTTVAVMANSGGCNELLDAIRAAAERRYAAPGAGGTPVAGTYLLRDGYPLVVETAGEDVTLTAPGQPPVRLIPLPTGQFLVPGLDCELTFGEHTVELNQEGRVDTARLTGP